MGAKVESPDGQSPGNPSDPLKGTRPSLEQTRL
jgi:hypothetical protein